VAQVSPEIWLTLSADAKKWLLNESKCQQQEDDKLKSHQVQVARVLAKCLRLIETIPALSQVNMQESKML
jgi:hypothetical protein